MKTVHPSKKKNKIKKKEKKYFLKAHCTQYSKIHCSSQVIFKTVANDFGSKTKAIPAKTNKYVKIQTHYLPYWRMNCSYSFPHLPISPSSTISEQKFFWISYAWQARLKEFSPQAHSIIKAFSRKFQGLWRFFKDLVYSVGGVALFPRIILFQNHPQGIMKW